MLVYSGGTLGGGTALTARRAWHWFASVVLKVPCCWWLGRKEVFDWQAVNTQPTARCVHCKHWQASATRFSPCDSATPPEIFNLPIFNEQVDEVEWLKRHTSISIDGMLLEFRVHGRPQEAAQLRRLAIALGDAYELELLAFENSPTALRDEDGVLATRVKRVSADR